MADATTYLYKVALGEVHDGDTLWIVADLGFYTSHATKIRMAGINAPELATDAGKTAKQALLGFIAAHPGQWNAQTYKTGEEKFGRWLATLFAPDGTNVNQWMLTNGYATPDAG